MIITTRSDTSSSFKLWHKRLTTQDRLSRGQIRQFGNAVIAGSRGYDIGGAQTNLDHGECEALAETFTDRVTELDGFRLELDHERFGLDWLRNDPKRARSLGVTEAMVTEEAFIGFRLMAYDIEAESFGYRATTFPIYRVLSKAGHVDYSWSRGNWRG